MKDPLSARSARNVERQMIIAILGFVLLPVIVVGQPPVESSHDFDSLARQADTAKTANRLGEAALLYQKALTLRPQWQEGWWSLGMVEYVNSDYRQCATAFEQLTKLSPKDGTAYVMLGLCEFELGKDSSALHHIEQGESIGVAPDAQLTKVARYHQGVLLQRVGKFQAAEQALKEVCVDGDQPRSLLDSLGMVALQMQDRQPPPAGSIAADVVSRVGLAMSYDAQRKLEQAHQVYASVAQQYPDFPNVHLAYGRFLSEQLDFVGASVELTHEIQNNPRNIMARLQIASNDYRVNSAAGVPYAEDAVRLDPKYPFAHYVLGMLLLDSGNYSKALSELELTSHALPRPSEEVYLALASAYAHLGRFEDAKRARALCAQLPKAHPAIDQNVNGQLDAPPLLPPPEQGP